MENIDGLNEVEAASKTASIESATDKLQSSLDITSCPETEFFKEVNENFPINIYQDDKVTIWHKLDRTFGIPKYLIRL